MCGFVGFTNNLTGDAAADVLQSMMNSIFHRGPDGSGIYTDDQICLGVRRLGISDLQSEQIIYNEDKTKILLFDGMIFNHEHLRQELEEKGHEFLSEQIGEVVLHGYEEYGQEIVDKLRGMFAFIIYDTSDAGLFGARDSFGVKPLYYFTKPDLFIFGSEIKALLNHPSVEKRLNRQVLEQYLSFQYSPQVETFFEGIFRLPAAHFFEYKNGELKIQRYFKPEFSPDTSRSFEEYTDMVESAVKESVDIHKQSTAPVGAFLSSGIDSSLISYVAGVDKTFTVGFGSGAYNEIVFAEEFSEFAGFENISRIISPEEFFGELGKIQYFMDEPLADPSAAALYFLAELAAGHVRVVLSGEGADELFGGYNIYTEPFSVAIYNKIPFFLRNLVAKVALKFPHVRGFNFLIRRGLKLEDRYIGNAFIFSKKEREKLLKSPVFAPQPFELCKPYYSEVGSADDVTKMQYLDINMWLVGDILLKADRMSMAHSLEIRSPFLDKQVLGLALKLPVEFRANKKETKICLRAAASKLIPQKTADKRKLGFPVPIRVWLRQQEYYQQVKTEFLSENAERFFNTKRLLRMLNIHYKGKRDLSRKIWTVYTFLVWYRQYF